MFVKQGFILILLVSIHYCCLSQYDNSNRRDSIKILNAKYRYYDLDIDKHHVPAALPFGSIRFVDMRYDTTFIAINWNFLHSGKTLKNKFGLSGGLAAHLTHYFSNYYALDNSQKDKELVCFIKRFSIMPEEEVLTHFMQKPDLMYRDENSVAVSIECFYRQGDSLCPAVRIDTMYSQHFLMEQTRFTDVVTEMLQPFQSKLERLDAAALAKKKRYGATQVWKNYTDRFQLPVLTGNGYKKGIYKTLVELKNATPSLDSFSVSPDKMKFNAGNVNLIDATSLIYKAIQKRNTAVFLYDERGELINPSRVFAYSDGETLWLQHGASFYPLVRVGNGFEFLYIYHYADSNARTETFYILMPLSLEEKSGG